MDDSKRLQQEFPGGNAEQIAQQEAIVCENWAILQERATQRKHDLQAAESHYRFMAGVSGCPVTCRRLKRHFRFMAGVSLSHIVLPLHGVIRP